MLPTHLTRLCLRPQATTSLVSAEIQPSALLQICLQPFLRSLIKHLPQRFLKFCSKPVLRCRRHCLLTECFDTSTRLPPRDNSGHLTSQVQETGRESDSIDNMLPFPYQGNQGSRFYQPYQNTMNPMYNQQQAFYLGQQMAFGGGMFMMNGQVQFKGRGRGGGAGGNVPFNQRNQFQQRQQYPQGDNNRNRNNLKRKSSEPDFGGRKAGRFQGDGSRWGPQNSSRSSFDTGSSTSMHMSLVNGAKPILHVPGQQCERITEAIVQYYNEYHQSEGDLKHKIVLSNCLYAIVRGIFPGCRLFIVGSSLSGFGTRTSDMDLCLLVTQVQDIDQKIEAVHILNAIHKSLRNCSFIKSSLVVKAKVPILKFTDSKKNIECDLNVNNGVGIRNTHLLKYYCLADPRVAPLMLFIKFWARFHDINDAHKRTISSYSLALMLIHYLQVCSPPVLPCLQSLYPDRFDMSVDLRNLRLDEPLEDLRSKNKDSLGKLFQGFLDYYAFEFSPEHDVISVRQGQVLDRYEVQRNSKEPMSWKYLCIEEPFELTNTARSVFDPYMFQRIQQVFRRSAQVLRAQNDVSAILSQPF